MQKKSEELIIDYDKEFNICAINWNIINNINHFYISLIDSFTSKIKVCEIMDNDFLNSLENILIQSAPAHEDINFYVAFNIPFESLEKKATQLMEKVDLIENYKIYISNNQFNNNKKNNYINNIKLFINEEFNTILNNNELIDSLCCFSGLVDIIQLQKYVEFHNKFSLEKMNNREFMNIDMICINSLNLIDTYAIGDDKKNFYKTHSISADAAKISLFKNNQSNKKESVFSILNRCCSKSGVRLLRTWILQPLQDVDEINQRLNIVELLITDFNFRKQLRDSYLSKISDIQNINFAFSKYSSKKDYNLVNLESLAKLKLGISIVRSMTEFLKFYAGIHEDLFKSRYQENFSNILIKTEKLEELLNKSIIFDDVLKEYTVNNELNKDLFDIREDINSKWGEIQEIKKELEKKLTKSTKVHIEENQNNGYMFYISKSEGEKLLKNKNCGFNHFGTNKAHIVLNNKKMENISSELKRLKEEYKLKEQVYHKKIIEVSSSYQPVLERMIYLISELDVLSSFSTMISDSSFTYTKPIFIDTNSREFPNQENQNKFYLKNSRHIILEWNDFILKRNNPFIKTLISNDCKFDKNTTIKLITGMNMGGKSTYLKQIGICVILAHMGCYVPCEKAYLPVIDQIFTRMGAGDIQLKGISTFMNEMIEVSSMINSATTNSLLLVDEIGRGTSTDDGIGLCYGILEYISQNLKCLSLFATHFSELTVMENTYNNIKNFSTKYSILDSGEIVMEYKIIEGIGSSSFGLNLLKLMRFDEKTIHILDRFTHEDKN